MRIINKRLLPGEDLKNALLELQKQQQLTAAVVLSSVGSLQRLNLRLAGATANSAGGPLRNSGPFEILSLNGSIGPDGVHMHMCVADKQGNCFGGHLLEGNYIFTTVELVVLQQDNVRFDRVLDPKTGFKELQISEVSS